MPVYCPSCRLANRDGSRFCNQCGTALADDLPSCERCFAKVSLEARFCSRCGLELAHAGVGVGQPASDTAPREYGRSPDDSNRIGFLSPEEDEPLEAEVPPSPYWSRPAAVVGQPQPFPDLPTWLFISDDEPETPEGQSEPVPGVSGT
jgi:hypothetical protein